MHQDDGLNDIIEELTQEDTKILVEIKEKDSLFSYTAILSLEAYKSIVHGEAPLDRKFVQYHEPKIIGMVAVKLPFIKKPFFFKAKSYKLPFQILKAKAFYVEVEDAPKFVQAHFIVNVTATEKLPAFSSKKEAVECLKEELIGIYNDYMRS